MPYLRVRSFLGNQPDLAGLRELSELEKQQGDEKQDCPALWADVAAVLPRTQK
jgi:hypothetical protein